MCVIWMDLSSRTRRVVSRIPAMFSGAASSPLGVGCRGSLFASRNGAEKARLSSTC